MKLHDIEHQAARAARIFGAALTAQIVADIPLGRLSDRNALAALAVSAVIAAGETTYRAFFPTVPVSRYVTPAAIAALESAAARAETAVLHVPPSAPVIAPSDGPRFDDHGQPIP